MLQINKMRVHYFFSNSGNVDDFYKNATVQLTLLDSNSKLLAEGKSALFKNFCVRGGGEIKAEKLFIRVLLHTTKMESYTFDVFWEFCDNLHK